MAPPQSSPEGSRTTKTLFVGLLAITAISGVVNIWHALQHPLPSTTESVIHQAMLDFLRISVRAKQTRYSVKKAEKSEQQDGSDEDGDDDDATRDTDDEEKGSEAKRKREIEVDAPSSGKEEQGSAQGPKNGRIVASKVAGLKCGAYGGPDDTAASEMVYWEDIPSDQLYRSPFHYRKGEEKLYMTFEPDGGGFNNIRMSMETVFALAIATGRTLVLPPAQRMYLLGKGRGQQKTDFGFNDFFPVHDFAGEHAALEIITMKEFLETVAMTGKMKHKDTGKVEFPPNNRTDWDGEDLKPLKEWLRNATHTPLWAPDKCLAVFPASGDHKDIEQLEAIKNQIYQEGVLTDTVLKDPKPVDATTKERMWENLARRGDLCVYDEEMQKAPVVHFMCNHKMDVRLLVHFYAFLFFEDWREDLWMKRFMRDHMRYRDEIQCAAARVVRAIRLRAKTLGPTDIKGQFDAFHIRRGDFQYKDTRIEADQIVSNTLDLLKPNSTIYIATDERDKAFFEPLKRRYDVLFLDDFTDELKGVNSNHFGMIDQLIASRGRIFIGCWHSTFTGFIMRMRGYHSVKAKLPGHEKGLLLHSFYYVPSRLKEVMHEYGPVQHAFFSREFPTSWRDLNKGVGNLPKPLVSVG